MAPENLNNSTSIIECRENGIGAVQKDQHKEAYQSLTALKKHQKVATEVGTSKCTHQTTDGSSQLFKTHLKPNVAILRSSLNNACPPLFNAHSENGE